MKSGTFLTIIGAGAWGTAMAQLLARNGHWVCLYTSEEAVAAAINQSHSNPTYLPDVELSRMVWATTDQHKAAEAKTIFVAVPVPSVREALAPFRGHITREHTMVALCKGIEVESNTLPFALIGESLGVAPQLAVAAGPNFAAELAAGKPMGMVVASHQRATTEAVTALLQCHDVRVEESDDPVGVQLCSAMKNVVALGVGLAESITGSHNTAAMVLSRGLQEMATLVMACGGARSTVYGLAGVGDTVLSSFGSLGRNRELGRMIGQGKPMMAAITKFKSTPEGVNSVVALRQLGARKELTLPICDAVYAVLYEGAGFRNLWA